MKNALSTGDAFRPPPARWGRRPPPGSFATPGAGRAQRRSGGVLAAPQVARAVAALAVASTLCVTTILAQRPDQPAFRAGVDLVSLNVTVTDGDSRYVTDIESEGFQVYEDGALQELTFFNRTQLPIALALLMDTSASMTEKMSTAQQAAIGFAERLREEDLASVIDFDSRVEILQSFTNAFDDLELAIRRTSAGGSTSLYNAIYISLKELAKIGTPSIDDLRRQAIVVLSDGEDTSSLVDFDEVLELAKRSDTVIYSIGLRSRDIRSRRGFREADFVLRQLAQETGGRAFFPQRVEDLSEIYQRISDELSSQYTLAYTSKNPLRDGKWRRLVVRVDRENVAARTKQGYYAPSIN